MYFSVLATLGGEEGKGAKVARPDNLTAFDINGNK